MIKKILWIIAILLMLSIAAGVSMFLALSSDIPRLPDDLRLLAYSPSTEIYARDGELLRVLGGREYVSIDRISPHFLNAVIAVEDKRFFNHRGVDHIATFRALMQNVIKLGGAPGGSTLTQQLAKNLFFSFERSWKRKILEAMAAMAIEDRFPKDKVLETYCNLVPFGNYAYGVERASLVYFGKHASELKLHEASLLAGLPNSPSRLNPHRHFERARQRQLKVLKQMAASGFIADNKIDSLYKEPLILVKEQVMTSQGSFPVDYALEKADQRIGSDLVDYGGIRIMTGIDPVLQTIAENTLANGVKSLEERLRPLGEEGETRLEGVLVAIDLRSGQVVAMAGGRNYRESPYNRAVKAKRGPGSTFKPVVYLTAMEKEGLIPVDVLVDRPVSIPIDRKRNWEPPNFSRTHIGDITLKLALMKSINSIAAQLIEQVSPESVIKTAIRLGVETPLEPHMSLALGAQGITVLEMANVFATIAREGVYQRPFVISRIEGRGGELLAENLSAGETRFDRETVYQLVDMMKGVIDQGGTGAVVIRRGFNGIAMGKTGTTTDHRDAWFIGATPFIVAAVWVGYDDYREMRFKDSRGVTGSSGAAPIWADFMIQATSGEPVRDFPRPPGITICYADPINGKVSPEEKTGYIRVALKEKDFEVKLAEALADTIAIDSSFTDTPVQIEDEILDE